MTMESILNEWETDRTRLRMVACDCDAAGRGLCGTRLLFSTLKGARERLWCATAIGPPSDMQEAIAQLLNDTDHEMLERALALVGLEWDVAISSRDAALVQMGAFERVPEWMRRLPCGLLWATRGCVFGPDLTRVPRALWAMERCYVPDGARPLETFSQGWEWGQQPAEGPALEPWSS